MNFSTNLKHLRVQNGYTQQELAKLLKKDYSTIGKWELGQRFPTMKDVMKIAEIFNIPLEELVNENMLFEKSTSSMDQELIQKIKSLNEDQKKAIINIIDTMK